MRSAESGAYVVAYGLLRGMLRVGAYHDIPKVCGDGVKLPFPDNALDAVTVDFDLRNVVNYKTGLVELTHVTKPGDQLIVYEFSTPMVPVFNTFYKGYLIRALPQIAKVVSSDPEACIYLAESVHAWSNQSQLAHDISASGWEDADW